jgi:hypothetical protein
MRGKLLTGAGVAAALLAQAGTAGAQGTYGDFGLDLGTIEPATEAKPRFVVQYRNPSDPDGKPPPVTGAVFRMPEGTRIDTNAVPQCHATDDQIRANGSRACPAESRVGSGKLTAVTGFGPPADPVTGDVTVFNGPDQLIEIVTVPGSTQSAGFDRLTIDGHVLTAHPPNTPGGPPDGRTSVKDVEIQIERGGYVTSPPFCGTAGWGYSASYDFANGAHHDIWHSHECIRPQNVPANAMGVRPSPSRVRVGRRVRVLFRVVSPSADCRRRAKVRFAGRRKLASPNGRASFTVRLERAGRHRVSVSKRGCRGARGFVTAVR